MKVIIVKNYEEASQEAAEIFINQVKEKPNSILGLATGSTPVRMYELLREDHEKNHTSYKDVKSYNLDEYFGLDASHPQSYHYFMYKNLFNGIDIKDENVHVPCGQGNIQENCDEYNKMLAENPVDIQLLGIGSNGHIGFNEPADVFDPSSVRPVSSEQMPLRSKHGIAELRYGSRLLNLPRSLTPCSQSMKHTQ